MKIYISYFENPILVGQNLLITVLITVLIIVFIENHSHPFLDAEQFYSLGHNNILELRWPVPFPLVYYCPSTYSYTTCTCTIFKIYISLIYIYPHIPALSFTEIISVTIYLCLAALCSTVQLQAYKFYLDFCTSPTVL